ncbi:MAG: hypothetical protein HFF36_04075 [Coprobacillus sp.]|nr:hypothetical protein [Coprobacillus sp.]
MIKKLEKASKQKVNVYYSKNEFDYFNWIKTEIGQKSASKTLRIFINFLIENEEIATEFIKYAYTYLDVSELVRIKNIENANEYRKKYKDIFFQKYGMKVDEAIDILINNGIVGK